MSELDLILVYMAIILGIIYSAVLPYYKVNQQNIAAGLPGIKWDNKYLYALIVNIIVNGFVAVLAVQAFQSQLDSLPAQGVAGLILAGFFWGAQSQKIAALVPDWLRSKTEAPSPVSLPK